MKRIDVLLLFQLFFVRTKAQTLTASDSAKPDYALDLRAAIFNNIVTTDPIYYAKSPLPFLLRFYTLPKAFLVTPSLWNA